MQKKSSKSPLDEIISGIGTQMIEVKDKVTDAVSTEFKVVKKAIKRKLANKKKAAVTKSKKAALKKVATKRPANKFQRKAKKAAKKSASNRMKK
jgi:hypothetical protein